MKTATTNLSISLRQAINAHKPYQKASFHDSVSNEIRHYIVIAPVLLVLVVDLLNLTLKYITINNENISLYASLLACVLATAVVLFRNPMYSLLSLIGVFFSVVAVYVVSGAVFLGIVFLIVYVGAVAILFLFVIMLLNVKSLTADKEAPLLQHISQFVALAISATLSAHFITILTPAVNRLVLRNTELLALQEATVSEAVMHYVNQQSEDVLAFRALYTEHSALFLIITYILLVAMLGAIVLATKTHEEETSIKGPTY
jgi:NADH-quinone oxidoreductase subunit J